MDEPKNKNQDSEIPQTPSGGDFAEKLSACEKQRDEYLSGWQRAKADFINYKKDEAKRFEEMARYGNYELIGELVSVLDNFDLAIAALNIKRPAPTPEVSGSESRPESVGIEKGVYMIRVQIEDILRKRGLEKIKIKVGDPFDPSLEEAVGESESDQPPDTITEEIESGYKLYDKIVRPARVKISKGPKKQ